LGRNFFWTNQFAGRKVKTVKQDGLQSTPPNEDTLQSLICSSSFFAFPTGCFPERLAEKLEPGAAYSGFI
jgi:hypothetical protein